jgi:integrase/recombinase XerD
MSRIFHGPLAAEFDGFLRFKRSLGFGYRRAEFSLREFDRFLIEYDAQHAGRQLDQAALAWLASKPERKAVSVSMDAAVLRQLFAYLRRSSHPGAQIEPLWPQLPTESSFVPYYLSESDVGKVLAGCAGLTRPVFRATLYRALLLVLYCTGIRFGEALRLRMRDVDLHAGTLFIEAFKGRARWVPFHCSLRRELERYRLARLEYAPAESDSRFFVGANRDRLPVQTASETIRRLFQRAGLIPATGRTGPRPYDFRHAFAVHRLSRWYRQGVDLQARLPWLSAYMGHVNIVGTETYLHATPELLNRASSRLRLRYRRSIDEEHET